MKYSKSQRNFRPINNYTNLSFRNYISPLSKKSSSILFLDEPNKNNALNKQFDLFSTTYSKNDNFHKKLYDNICIFHKRQCFYNKNKEDNKKVFKYRNFVLFNEQSKTTRNRRNIRKKKIELNTDMIFSKMFMTDSETMLPKLNIKNLTNDFFNSLKKDKSEENIKKNKKIIFNKINYFLNERPKSKIYKRNSLSNKMVLYKNIKNQSLLPGVYISELRNYLLEKKEVNLREENIRMLMDNEQDKLGLLDEKINNLQKYYSHFTNIFHAKFNEYIKFIYCCKEKEIEIDNKYIKQLVKLKKAVEILSSAKRKIELNKNSFNRWTYLQICMKEKIITIPESYKNILEANDTDKDILINKYGENLFKHVMQYKNKIIYNNADEFLNQFNIYENKNLDLLKMYHLLTEQIRTLENEKRNVEKINKLENDGNYFNDLIKTKTKELKRLKYENIILKKNIEPLISHKNKMGNNETINIKKNSKLFNKINKIIEKLNSYNYISLDNNEINNPYVTMSDQQIIINYLSKIEIVIDILAKKYKFYKELYPQKMNEIKALLDKEKKMKNSLEKILSIKKEIDEEQKKIFKKYQKIIILPTRKLNIYDIRSNMDINKFNRKKINKNKNIKNKSSDIEAFLNA